MGECDGRGYGYRKLVTAAFDGRLRQWDILPKKMTLTKDAEKILWGVHSNGGLWRDDGVQSDERWR